MANKLLPTVIIIILLTCTFVMFTTVVNAKGLNLFCSKKLQIVVTLKNDAKLDMARSKILEIPQVKIIKTIYRDEEWSRMVNKMDLPKMENPFKNEFVIKTKRNADINEIYSNIKEMDFVEEVKYVSDTKDAGN